jgi:hypothetical protein
MRTAITGLLSLAAGEEQLLLLADGSTGGSPDCWAAVPLVAHLTHFKEQQTERISALLSGHEPPAQCFPARLRTCPLTPAAIWASP